MFKDKSVAKKNLYSEVQRKWSMTIYFYCSEKLTKISNSERSEFHPQVEETNDPKDRFII